MMTQKIAVKKGDLAVHSGTPEPCLVLHVNEILGSGFQSVDIMWCGSGKIETVMLQYIKTVQRSDNIYM